jgi:hypothetical protein
MSEESTTPDLVELTRSVFEAGSHLGARGYRDWLLNTQETIGPESRLEQVSAIDEDRVLAIMPTSGRGKSSGVALKEERLAGIESATLAALCPTMTRTSS